MSTTGKFTVSGPDVDKGYPDAGVALSAAITFAERSRRDATFYVRDEGGEVVGRVEHRGRGTTVHSMLAGVAS